MTKITPKTVGLETEIMHSEPMRSSRGDELFYNLVPCDHTVHVLQQVVNLNISMSIHVVKYKTNVMYAMLSRVTDDVRQASLAAMLWVMSGLVSWDHVRRFFIAQFMKRDLLQNVQNGLQLWCPVNIHVERNGPFVPLKLYKQATQSVYSKKIGRVDGTARYRAVSRSQLPFVLRTKLSFTSARNN